MTSQTVSQFAAEINMPADLLLTQLRSAGVEKSSASEPLSKEDKDRLLTYLRALHRDPSEPEIKLPSQQQKALQAIADDENGAEWRVLEELTWATLSNATIEHDFQTAANAIVAKIFLLGRLPKKRKGRPKGEGGDGWDISSLYYFFKDGGDSYEQAVAKVAQKFCKDERHIMRLVKENKYFIGDTLEERTRTRKWWAMCAEYQRESKAEGRTNSLDHVRKILAVAQERDFIAELEDIIRRAISNEPPADIK
ncbi:hypothetical protein C7C56_004160 [Massilia glaciei]|uniref:Translation initiation factor IF-2 N-terminal domain-containing protein n=1 Tax=Massilia glaciei TaxID=1524097 RepID=A0A2U2I5G2_9BURK|nr:hypothetical protein C7C56_004160 [Massilia glaciei]